MSTTLPVKAKGMNLLRCDTGIQLSSPRRLMIWSRHGYRIPLVCSLFTLGITQHARALRRCHRQLSSLQVFGLELLNNMMSQFYFTMLWLSETKADNCERNLLKSMSIQNNGSKSHLETCPAMASDLWWPMIMAHTSQNNGGEMCDFDAFSIIWVAQMDDTNWCFCFHIVFLYIVVHSSYNLTCFKLILCSLAQIGIKILLDWSHTAWQTINLHDRCCHTA